MFRPGAQQAVQAHTQGLGLDLLGVGRAHRAQPVGEVEPGLEEADPAPGLVALDVEAVRRQPELADAGRVEQALEGEIVDGQHGGRPGLAGVGEVGGCQARLPIVAVDEIRTPVAVPAHADLGGHPRQEAVAAVIVLPVAPVRAEIGVARAAVEVGGVQHDQVEAGGPAQEQADRPAHGVVESDRPVLALDAGKHRGIAGYERANLDPQCCQGTGQGTRHVGEPAGLDQRVDLRGDRQDPHGVSLPAGRSSAG